MLIVSPKAEIARPFFDNLVYVAAGNLYLRKSDDHPSGLLSRALVET